MGNQSEASPIMAEQKQSNSDDDILKKYTVKISVNEDSNKLYIAVKNKETKYIYGASLSPADLKNSGFPTNLSKNLQVVSEYIESVLNGKHQCTFTIQEAGDDHVILRITQSVIIDIVLTIPKKERPPTDIVADHIADVKGEIQALKAQVIATELENQRLKQHVMPQGAVVMWTGTANDIPNGWTLCDGSNGTPDLQNRFVIGASDQYPAHQTGGHLATAALVDAANMPPFYALCFIKKIN